MRKLSFLITVIGLDYRHLTDFSLLHQSFCSFEVCVLSITAVLFLKAVTAVSGRVNKAWWLKQIIFCLFIRVWWWWSIPLCFFFLWTDNLLIDYQFTFSLIQEDDNHYTAINFMASPEQVNISYCTCVAAFSLTDEWICWQDFQTKFLECLCVFNVSVL